MALPVYTVKLIDETKAILVDQQTGGVDEPIEQQTTQTRLGQTFLINTVTTLFSVTVKIKKFGSPSYNILMKLYESDRSTLLVTSHIQVPTSVLTTNYAEFTFFFDPVSLSASTTYFLEISTDSGTNNQFHYVLVEAGSTTGYTDGDLWSYGTPGPVWTQMSTKDLVFKIITQDQNEIDITSDVHEITNINTGLNGVYGSIKQGEALIAIKNNDSKYSLLNDSSPLFGKFRPNNKIKIEVLYDVITYNLFTGIIEDIEPILDFNQRLANVRLLDVFNRFQELTVSIGTQIGKTASELITLLLIAGQVRSSEYNIEDDFQVLQDVTWDDVNLIEKLNEIVEAGQHYHFIDGDGIYQFKNNQFLSDDTPDFSYSDVEDEPEAVRQRFNLSDINNIISVEYTGSLFETKTDDNSVLLFGERTLQLQNDLIKTQDDAGFIADYILSLVAEAGNVIEIDLPSLFPDIFKIEFGTVVKLTDAFHNIDNVYNVLEKTFNRPPKGDAKLKIKARKFVFPPAGNVVLLEPFQDDADITIPGGSTVAQFLQGFKVVNDGAAIEVSYKIDFTSGSSFVRFACQILELDGSGFPTGSILATSNLVTITTFPFVGTLLFTFPSGQRPTLVNTKTYGFVVQRAIGGFQGDVKLRGKTTDVYANGKPAYFPDGGPWTTLHPNDFYFRALIKEV